MILWFVMAGLVGLALLVLVWALFKDRPTDALVSHIDVSLFEEQLAAAEDAEARAEIGRRILRSGRHDIVATGRPLSLLNQRLWLAGLVVLVPLLSVGLYGLLGKPGQPSQFRGLQTQEEITEGASIEELVPYMASMMRRRPDDVGGWRLLASTAGNIGRHDLVVIAFANLARLFPNDAGILASWAEAKIAVESGLVTPDARALLAQAIALDPSLPSAQYYLGLYDMQQGDAAGAKARWQALLDNTPADAPWADRLRQAMDQLSPDG